MKHHLERSLWIEIPDDYKKIPLSWFEEWTEALDSGKYSQNFDFLEGPNGLCCLGVLSLIQGRLINHRDNTELRILDSDNPCFDRLDHTGHIPNNITIRNEINGHSYRTLSALNDDRVPFSTISQVIKHIWKSYAPKTIQN